MKDDIAAAVAVDGVGVVVGVVVVAAATFVAAAVGIVDLKELCR